jgi:hypothetical protein
MSSKLTNLGFVSRLNIEFASPRETASKTRAVVADNLSVFVLTSIAYLAAYLLIIGDLSYVAGGAGFSVEFGSLSNAFRRVSTFYFEPVASVTAGPVFFLVSVGNLLIGGFIAALVGANLTFTYVSIRNPSACSARNKTGLLSAVPALAAGTACCAPTIFLVFGIQASAGLLALQSLALPVSIALLVVALSMVAPKVDVEMAV